VPFFSVVASRLLPLTAPYYCNAKKKKKKKKKNWVAANISKGSTGLPKIFKYQ